MKRHGSIQHLLDFRELFNDIERFEKLSDLAEYCGITEEAVKSKAKRYRMTRKAYPELGLPPILDRNNLKDGLVYIDDGAIPTCNAIDYDKLGKKGKYVITSAQYGADVNTDFLRSLKIYCKANDATLVILPIKYGRMLEGMKQELDGHICYKSTNLNNNIGLNTINIRPTTVSPLSSLKKHGHHVGQICASPKVDMDMIASHKTPKPIMTTGAVTYPFYKPDKTGQIAERDHKFAAVIVDIKDEEVYHFRHVISPDGKSFSDIDGKKYTPKGVRKARVSALVCGDWHTGYTCPKVRKATYGIGGIVRTLKPLDIVKHDFFDGHSISHHDEKNATVMAQKAAAGMLCLKTELEKNRKEIEYILKRSPRGTRIVMVASNHNDHLDRYLAEQRYNKDHHNKVLALELHHKTILSGIGAFQTYIQDNLSKSHNDAVKWLSRDDEYMWHGINLGMHGDVGANGSRGSLKVFDNHCHGSVTGHTHQPSIKGNAYQVGTSTLLRLPYTKGLSSWLNTHAVVYETGQVQLINIIDGKWR